MGDWGIALIAAGSALAGSAITGWFARSAGVRQADALLRTVRMTLAEQRAVRVLDLRRQTYVRFLESAETVMVSRRTGLGGQDDRAVLERAFTVVLLEGPAEVAQAARDLLVSLRAESASLDDLERARRTFVDASRAVLGDPGTPVR